MKRILLHERFRRPPWFLDKDHYLREGDHPVTSGPNARYPRLVPLLIFDYGSLWGRIKRMVRLRQSMTANMRELRRANTSIRENPRLGNTRIDATTLADLETYARSLGVSEIGYTRVNPDYIFKDLSILYPNAIVFAMEMDLEKIEQAPSVPTLMEIFRTYYQLGYVVNQISDFLRERGFNAHAGPALGSEGSFVPMARDAGLGEVGKNGMLITKTYGPRVRLAAVYTDIENLPFAEENPHAWVRDYCDMCNSCVKHCPANAIFLEPREAPEGGPVFIDHKKCAVPFSTMDGCTLCIKHCPFMYGRYDQLHERQRTHSMTASKDSEEVEAGAVTV
ncbi:4Fe-4S dicluster domain-containing protein [Anaerosoma tenue]|uniref:4Fe-4S dicluster domain-containing protein n=1 Tax=Anaerosoma tenue TaxID=2933588 RepID=UPI00226093A0|nr:4Fe-4S dicluster domain-containing protein [Anaerosoma tenue]MCK8115921.1 4Fe-4S dicluster domain-containing protein [Anaerosoma tenue]